MDSLSVSGGGVFRNFRFSPGASLSVSPFATSTCRPPHRRRLHGGVAFWPSTPSWPSLWAGPCVQRPLVVFLASGVACERARRGPVCWPSASPGASPAVLEKTSAVLKNTPFQGSCKYTKFQRHMTPESALQGCARMRSGGAAGMRSQEGYRKRTRNRDFGALETAKNRATGGLENREKTAKNRGPGAKRVYAREAASWGPRAARKRNVQGIFGPFCLFWPFRSPSSLPLLLTPLRRLFHPSGIPLGTPPPPAAFRGFWLP